MRPAEPLHIIFAKDLNDFTVDGDAALKGLAHAAAGGHVRAEFQESRKLCWKSR